ncbi:MAG: M48 family metalloprotease, partial [Candidatus Omnitrophica bacterium]|nr:M48 family metalloprotease [Candidatus Omnitrophota bacterium]
QGAAIALNMIMLGYSREDEFEADRLGVKYAYYAGFDPNGSVTFLEKLQNQEKENPLDKGLVYLRSHPLYSERITRSRAYAAYLKEYDPAKQRQVSPVPHN